MRCLVLTYHGNNVLGHDYGANDHVALREDLARLAALAIPVVPLPLLAQAFDDPRVVLPDTCVALSFDDGSWFDWYDLEHPTLGMQRSFANVMRDQSAGFPHTPLHATSFVIVGPQARSELDRTCLIGRGWWGDEWWSEAIGSGRFAIENHSWDHHHDTLDTRVTGLPGGTFRNVADHAAASAEIASASAHLDRQLPMRRTRLFAYPYGESNPFLVEEYLPHRRAEHGLAAAFGTRPEPVTAASNRWLLGRYVCGQHWRSPEEFVDLLRSELR